MNILLDLIMKQKAGLPAGIYSCCSASPYVLKAAIRKAVEKNTCVLIEATANQVNQFGGYTGMKPADFYCFAKELAVEQGLPEERLILGGDHLGPLTWTAENESSAMTKAEELVRQYVLAGFTKIHLDTSMRVADDDTTVRLSDETIARRGARLCAVAEQAYAERLAAHPDAPAPVYVIGSEVPIPGGAQEKEDSVSVTRPEDCRATYETFRAAYEKENLQSAWQRVIAIVVQPGVEFGDEDIVEYNREKAKALTASLAELPIVFEGHSTDYQTPVCLREMVEDGIAILKVGPALTFALREALYALEDIEKELFAGTGVHCSNFRDVLEHAMLEDDKNWKKHYHGDGNQLKRKRAFSFSDRARYYLPAPAVQAAVDRLVENLRSAAIPTALISQYLPRQYTKIRAGMLKADPEDMILDRIGDCIDEYLYATIRQ